MLATAALVFAQSSITLSVGRAPADSAGRARSAARQLARERRLDSLRATRPRRDSLRALRRAARVIPVTPALLASAFRDPAARDLLQRARAARLTQDSTLRGYDAMAYERASASIAVGRIGPRRLVFRSEQASRVQWTRGVGAVIDVRGSRQVAPVVHGAAVSVDGDLSNSTAVPYLPGVEQLLPASGLMKTDVAGSEIIHPLVSGAESYYTYASGDSVRFRLPGRELTLRELLVRPRAPRWNSVVGSLWFDASSAQLVRAVYRLAAPMDVWSVARADAENGEDPQRDVPRWLRPMLNPMVASVSAITVEYGLYGGRYWLPRAETVEGEGRVNLVRVPFSLEQSFRYSSVNGDVPVAPLQIAALDTATDSASRARRHAARAVECKSGTTRSRVSRAYEGTLTVLVRVPCDTAQLVRSSELPGSIYNDDDALFGAAERDALVQRALGLASQPAWAPQPPEVRYGLPYTRYNRVEGLSSAVDVTQVLGAGYTAHAQARLGLADLSPNGELSLARSNGRQTLGLGVYRRLAVSNDWGAPLSLSASLGALLFARDEGFYYRTWGAELTGESDDGMLGGLLDSWRLYAQQDFDAPVATQLSLARAISSSKRFPENIDASNVTYAGVALRKRGAIGADPAGLRLLSDFRADAGVGGADFVRGMLDLTAAHPIGRRLDGALTLGGGMSSGALPVQRLWYLGGVGSVRGEPAGAMVGNAYWLTRGELGGSFRGARPVLFGDVGWAGNRSAWRTPGRPASAVGVGMSFLDGLLRLDVARGLYPVRGVRASLYVGTRF